MAHFYSHQNNSVASTLSSTSRRISANNPFRQPNGAFLSNYKTSFGSNSTPTISEVSGNRNTVNPEAFESWIKKNQELETLSDDDNPYKDGANDFDFVDTNVFIKPSAPRRAGSESSVLIHPPAPELAYKEPILHNNMSNYSNNPFADALAAAPTGASATSSAGNSSRRVASPPVLPRTYKSVPPPVNRASKDLPPPSYEEAAGREAAQARYRDEKEASSSSRPHHRSSSHRHRSHSESAGHREHKSSRDGSHRDHKSSRDGSRHHHHHSSSRTGKSRKSSKEVPVRPENLDTIDKLDVTGLFGGGFHHDGPFEACTPHRNQNKKAAPVMLFPLDGPNSSIKGAAQPIKEQLIDYLFGVPNEDDLYQSSTQNGAPAAAPVTQLPASQLYTNTRTNGSSATIRAIKNDMSVVQFDSSTNSRPIHGHTTLGLGSSTFIDGAPLPKTAIVEEANQSSLGRKKSLVHRVKSIRRKN